MSRRAVVVILVLGALAGAALVIYSQTAAFAWDEGFHLLTAQSINRGLRPYIDFCFSQTPLNAYWNAAWFWVFDDTWRTAHAVAAVMTTLAVLLTATSLLLRFPEPAWRTASAVSAVFVVALNSAVFQFGTIAQAYGLCLFLIVFGYICAVTAVDRASIALPAAAGFLACAAANSSLLTAPVAPVLLLWMLWCSRAGNRWIKGLAFCAGGVLAFLPLAWLFVQGPRQTVFGVLDYNLLYRKRQWAGAVRHNIDEYTAWLASPQALMLGLLALFGLWFVWKRSGWPVAVRREFYLCAGLAVALIAHISTAFPTFTRYYLLAVPFLAILACAGLYGLGSRLAAADRFWPPAAACVISALCLSYVLYQARDDYRWSDSEKVAAKVNQVTPPHGMLLADEPVYFITRRPPPPGMELADSHKLDFPPGLAAKYHVISLGELERREKAGVFDTIETENEEEEIQRLGLRSMYAHSADVVDSHIFWGKR